MSKSDIPLTRSWIKDRAIAFLHPLRRPVTWACQHRLLPSRVRRLLPWRWAVEPFTIYGNGWKCQWYPAEFDDITHTIFWSGLHDYEKETIPVMLDQIRQARCFIDVGANCGIYTVLAATIHPNVQIVAIEPVPKICAALTNNVRQNSWMAGSPSSTSRSAIPRELRIFTKRRMQEWGACQYMDTRAKRAALSESNAEPWIRSQWN